MYTPVMAQLRLSAINLNLLPALDAVLQERHVTRAAARLGVTQSAMSYTLRQLRDLLDDPLLVRGPQGMVRTARGEELAPKVRAALEAMERALAPGHFEPSTATRGFSIATADSTFYTTILPLQTRLAQQAPGVRLRLSQLGLRPYQDRLEAGEIDLGIGMGFGEYPGIHSQMLYDQDYAVVARQGHPEIQGEISLEQFVAADHIIVTRSSARETTRVDDQLARQGLERRIAMQVPTFPLALAATRATDLLLSGPTRFLRSPEASRNLQVMDHPLVQAQFPVWMVWHERSEREPANRWLRDQVLKAVETPD
ncbi:MAG: LysR substrate-binding domain-containing protein [Myxococcota bacterium]